MADKKQYLTGTKQVMAKLHKAAEKIKDRSQASLIESARIIMNDTENTSPKTPIDTGNLRASRFIVSAKSNVEGDGRFKGTDAGILTSNHGKVKGDAKAECMSMMSPFVIFGFSANYAVYVHELVGNRVYNRPGSGPKFLEASIKRNTDKVKQILKTGGKI